MLLVIGENKFGELESKFISPNIETFFKST